jgi:hypothetical protein
MMPAPTSAPPTNLATSSVANTIAEITAKVRTFETETYFPAKEAHSLAEAAYFALAAADRTDERYATIEQLSETWLAAVSGRENLVSDLIEHEPRSAPEILALGKAFVGLTTEQNFFGNDPKPHQRMLSEDKDLLLDFFISSLERLADDNAAGGLSPVGGQPGAWEAAKAAFEAATERMNIAGDAISAAEAAIKAELNDADASVDAKAAHERHKAAHERHGYKALEEQWNAALLERDNALDALLREPAPDMKALAFKAWHAAVDRTGSELDAALNMKTLNELAQSSDSETSIPAVICQDVLRLAGSDDRAFNNGSDVQLVADLNEVIRLHTLAMQKSRAGRSGAAGDYLDDADVPMQRSLRMRATTADGLAARARLVEDWCTPVDALDREDLEWRLISALTEDVKALFGAEVRTSPAVAIRQPELLAAE